MVEDSFNGRPVVLQIDVGFCHDGRFMPVPLVDGVRRPTPFLEVWLRVELCGCPAMPVRRAGCGLGASGGSECGEL